MNKYEKAINELKNVSYDDRHSTMLLETHREELYTLNELVERATPKKVKDYHDCTKMCPSCHNILSQDLQYGGRHHTISKFCPECGQALDWSD